MKWPLWLLAALICSPGLAQTQHQLVRRVTVFPIKAPKELSAAAEEAWWKVREVLTENKRFLVASKNFLIQKDVFQPRGELTPADAIILGRLLDANALVTTHLEERTLHMRVYEGEYGRLLWQHEVSLHPSLPLSEQIETAGKNLINDFISAIPYQGFVVVDSLKGQAVYSEEQKQYVRADIGAKAQVEVGDVVQFVRLYSDSLKPLFSPDAVVEVFAEGKVAKINRDFVTVELERIVKGGRIEQETLVRLPKEWQRLRDVFAINQELRPRINNEYFSPEISPVQESINETRPLVTSLTFILNIAAFLLLAF